MAKIPIVIAASSLAASLTGTAVALDRTQASPKGRRAGAPRRPEPDAAGRAAPTGAGAARPSRVPAAATTVRQRPLRFAAANPR